MVLFPTAGIWWMAATVVWWRRPPPTERGLRRRVGAELAAAWMSLTVLLTAVYAWVWVDRVEWLVSSFDVDPLAGMARPGSRLQIPARRSITSFVETPSFTFRLERVRSLRERAEERAREDLANELRLRLRGESMLREATYAASTATQAGRDAVLSRSSGMDLIAAQAYIERAERTRREAALDLDRQDAEVAARRVALQDAARDRQVMDKLEQRQRADHNRAWARKAQSALDEVALSVHRRGQVTA